MKTLKENLKDIFTDIIGGILILLSLYLYVWEGLEWQKALVLFCVGIAFFFIPDDILSQMTQKFINKKIDGEKKE